MTLQRAAWPLIAIAAIASAWLVSQSGPGQRLEYALVDSGVELLRHAIDSDVVIIAIDAKSIAELEEWPWPRRYHAELVRRLAPAAPRQLFLDIDFSARSNPVDDVKLADALADWRSGPLILPAFFQRESSADNTTVLTKPMPMLRSNATLASVNMLPGDDGLVRHVRSAWSAEGNVLPSVTAALNGQVGTQEADYWVDYTIDPVSFHTVSFSDVLANRVPAQYFADKTVFVGATAIELGDTMPVPVYQALPGVVVQAISFESVRDGLHEPLPASLYWGLVTVWSLLLAFAFRQGAWRRNCIVATGALGVLTGAALYAYATLAIIVHVVPFAWSAIAVYLFSALHSLESETIRALMYAVGFRKRDALLKSIVLSSTDCIICMDANGLIKTANPAAARLFGVKTGNLAGQLILQFIPTLLRDSAGGGRYTFDQLSSSVAEFMARTVTGDEFPVEMSISRVRLKEEQLYTAIVRDISERKAQQRQLQFQATHDPLTTLPNRPALAAHLDALLQTRKAVSQVALLMIDLNRFKEVNDTLGHNIGDYVLYEVARRLGDIAKDRGFIARIGGDEFALVVDRYVDTAEISGLSQALLDCLKQPVETCGIAIDIGLSVGIALYPSDARTAEELFQHSDVAMYVAKRSGSGFEFYDPASDKNSFRRLEIATRLRKAIAQNELQLHFQPQVNLQSGRVESVEALVRWQDPVLGFVGPDEFITLAETTDLIQPLSTWTLEQAFRQSVQWRDDGLDLRVAINVSARLLQDAGFPARIDELLTRFGVRPDRIELEITESAMMIDPERALRVTEALHALGVLISIDDYGTGYSSLAYLRDLPAHALKLDKSFVTDMEHKPGDRIIAESTVQMAHALNLDVVAEGVETQAIADMLAVMGYNYAQGYLYSPALSPDALYSWVTRFHQQGMDNRCQATFQ